VNPPVSTISTLDILQLDLLEFTEPSYLNHINAGHFAAGPADVSSPISTMSEPGILKAGPVKIHCLSLVHAACADNKPRTHALCLCVRGLAHQLSHVWCNAHHCAHLACDLPSKSLPTSLPRSERALCLSRQPPFPSCHCTSQQAQRTQLSCHHPCTPIFPFSHCVVQQA